MLAPDQAMLLAALGANIGPESLPAGSGSIFTGVPAGWGDVQWPFASQPSLFGNSMAALQALAPVLGDPRDLPEQYDTMGDWRPKPRKKQGES